MIRLPAALAADAEALETLLQRAGVDAPEVIEPLPGGRNNRVYRVTSCSKPVLLKTYFHSPDDPRDRLRQEYEFCAFSRNQGCDCIAGPLASDPVRHWAVYEFIEGTKLSLAEITAIHINAAASFVLALNARRREPAADKLLPASEACFSLDAHLETVRARIGRLSRMDEALPVDREARQFVLDEVRPAFEIAERRVRDSGALLARQLTQEERCLSPSDFGFHNALVRSNGALAFVDFEFAGWDDPAKLIVDFANQPDMLLPDALSALFQKALIERGGFGDDLPARVRLVEPLYQIKWACICLNDFLHFGRHRRSFVASGDEGAQQEASRKTQQLQRARQMTSRLSL